MKIGFYTPGTRPHQELFGCASFGIVGHENEREVHLELFGRDLEGVHIFGTYDECLLKANGINNASAAIVLLGNAGDENVFLRELRAKLRCPLTGGGAAINTVTGETGLLSHGSQANIFVITDPSVRVETAYSNIHSDILGEHRLEFSDPRQLDRIDGEDALSWLAREKAQRGVSDFEHMTFSTPSGTIVPDGINAHLSVSGGKLVSGRVLEEKMLLRCVSHSKVYESIRSFYDDENAIVFGCAGLKGILDEALCTPSLGLFLFGEICDTGSTAEFGNLMLSKIRITPAVVKGCTR